MGDSRAYVKIEFEIYGKKFATSMDINWSPDDGVDGPDRRVISWFESCYQEAHSDWRAAVYASEAEARARHIEAAELEVLKRLKAKYEKPSEKS